MVACQISLLLYNAIRCRQKPGRSGQKTWPLILSNIHQLCGQDTWVNLRAFFFFSELWFPQLPCGDNSTNLIGLWTAAKKCIKWFYKLEATT